MPLLVPDGEVTVICTVPDPAGAVVSTWVSDTTVKVAATAPKCTDVTPVNPLPVNVTVAPAGPDAGVLTVITGAAGAYVKAMPLLVPDGEVTVTCTVPEPAGAVAEITVADTTVNDAATTPKRTDVTPVNPLPVSNTVVPAGPDAGVAVVMIGAVMVILCLCAARWTGRGGGRAVAVTVSAGRAGARDDSPRNGE
ncbi:hypothetical protein GCM10009665_24980 [Kitasatospora nipponensis]|uniref:Ig-like domain-containing protein n=1 Tax=Kitasatospora nipponensis TaxID=258049 RepID=A0ABN1W3G9_9ACTN